MTRAAIERAVKRALAYWRPLTDTEHWEIDVFWHDTPGTYDGRTMGMVIQPEYEAAELYVNVDLIEQTEATAKTLEYDTLHELAHLHTAALVALAEGRSGEIAVRHASEIATKKFASACWRAHYLEEPPVRGT